MKRRGEGVKKYLHLQTLYVHVLLEREREEARKSRAEKGAADRQSDGGRVPLSPG